MRIVTHQILGFVVVGAIAFAVDWGLLVSMIFLFDLGLYWGRAISFSTAVMVTWWLNRTYSFCITEPPKIQEALKYLTTVFIGGATNWIIYLSVLSIEPAARAQPLFALIPATAVSMIINFTLMRAWPFRFAKYGRDQDYFDRH